MTRRAGRERTSTAWLIAGSCVAMLVLAWFGQRSSLGWRRTAVLLQQSRAEEAADLVLRSLARDMRGVDESVLSGLHWDEVSFSAPEAVRDVVASAFARYPYPEAFFGWDGPARSTDAIFFARAERPPAWLPALEPSPSFPVRVLKSPDHAATLIARVAPLAEAGRRFAAFELQVGGHRYQVVARLLYRDARRMQLAGVFGFMVNLEWARVHYFPELVSELSRLTTTSARLRVAIHDGDGRMVAGTTAVDAATPVATRPFWPLFFERELTLLSTNEDLVMAPWSVQVDAGADPTLAVAIRSAESALVWTTLAALAFGVGLWLTARAMRAHTALAQLRADFVASVTHELKTPLATILSASQALVRGRVTEAPRVVEYAQLLDQEAKRLGRLVSNLLAYSRITDVQEAYAFEPLAPLDVVDEALRGFQPQFEQHGFAVETDVSPHLPPIRGDRSALAMVFDNLIDNALRYSTTRRTLRIQARQQGAQVVFDVQDQGVGIPPEELSRVERRFVRGRQTRASGSGLGLAIVGRLVRDHGGTFTLESVVGSGTTVRVSLPMME